jgi:hypothetical protein
MGTSEDVDIVQTPRARLIYLACLAAGAAALLIQAYRSSAEEPKDKATYIGTDECKKCHMKEHMTYKKTGMFKDSWPHIAEAADKDKCYACHTTGYGKPGGFVSPEKTPNLQGVGCESCHGAGSAHAEAARTAEKDKKLDDAEVKKSIHALIDRHSTRCAECHNPHIADKAAEARKKK